MSSPNFSALFDLNGFHTGAPFNETNPLNPLVTSDHAAIITTLKYNNSQATIGAVNISNKEYHPYFELGDNPPFKNTHMFVPDDSQDPVKKAWLISKTESQMNTLVKDLLVNKVDIQIIVEGYYDFLTELEDRLQQINNYKIISVLNDPTHTYKGKQHNITGIIVNTTKFKIDNSGVILQMYVEAEYIKTNGPVPKESRLILPWTRVINLETGMPLIVFGVHLPGCNSQFPKTAIGELYKIMQQFRIKYPGDDIMSLGDYNTVPWLIKEVMKDVNILPPKYPTHINPSSNIASYDNVIYWLTGNCAQSIEYKDYTELPQDSQALVLSLVNSRKIGLDKVMYFT